MPDQDVRPERFVHKDDDGPLLFLKKGETPEQAVKRLREHNAVVDRARANRR